MKILAHRGYWTATAEKNTLKAFRRAIELGFGIETDIRDFNGRLVISHDPPTSDTGNLLPLTELLAIHKEVGENVTLALNIKADGLYLLLDTIGEYFSRTNHFFFDMSVPEQWNYINQGFSVFTRSSEFEPLPPVLLEQSKGIWLDQFTDCNHIISTLPALMKRGKSISVVSPELHGRDYLPLWTFLKQYMHYDNLLLCTDNPEQAKEYFK